MKVTLNSVICACLVLMIIFATLEVSGKKYYNGEETWERSFERKSENFGFWGTVLSAIGGTFWLFKQIARFYGA
jgi:hypothetical protein